MQLAGQTTVVNYAYIYIHEVYGGDQIVLRVLMQRDNQKTNLTNANTECFASES